MSSVTTLKFNSTPTHVTISDVDRAVSKFDASNSETEGWFEYKVSRQNSTEDTTYKYVTKLLYLRSLLVTGPS